MNITMTVDELFELLARVENTPLHIGPVKIEVRSDQDPTRIAKDVYDTIKAFAEKPHS